MEDKKEEKLENFIEDWKVDLKHKSAVHLTGLNIAYVMDNDDGTIKMEFENLVEWQSKQLKEGFDSLEVMKLQSSLVREFAVVYAEKMMRKKQPANTEITSKINQLNQPSRS